MNWAQFKDPVSHMCLADAVLVHWSLTQEVSGSSPFYGKYFLLLNSLNSVITFWKNSIVFCLCEIKSKQTHFTCKCHGVGIIILFLFLIH